eukprot:m.27612 g.27612  ORF g.27612 m.27612 type:complete len:700 (-) comp15777_c0_seq1:1951-4050(-)
MHDKRGSRVIVPVYVVLLFGVWMIFMVAHIPSMDKLSQIGFTSTSPFKRFAPDLLDGMQGDSLMFDHDHDEQLEATGAVAKSTSPRAVEEEEMQRALTAPPIEIWMEKHDLVGLSAKPHVQQQTQQLQESAINAKHDVSLPSQVPLDANPMEKFFALATPPTTGTTAITLESIVGRRCIDWNPGKQWVGTLWTCKTAKATWFETWTQILEWEVVVSPTSTSRSPPLSSMFLDAKTTPRDSPQIHVVRVALSYKNERRCLQPTPSANARVSFEICVASELQNTKEWLMQAWRYIAVTGTHKIYGLLWNMHAQQCLSRNVDAPWELTMSDCDQQPPSLALSSSVDRDRHDCLQLWSAVVLNTSRFMNRVESDVRTFPFVHEPPSKSKHAVDVKDTPNNMAIAENANKHIQSSHSDNTRRDSDAETTTHTRGSKLKILCWILTYPKTHENRAVAVNRTWGRWCDTLLFMTTQEFATLPVVKLNLDGPEGRGQIWPKTKRSWMHVYQHYIDKADWFIKADDDTFVVWDNLVKFLSRFDSNQPHFFGRRFIPGGEDEERSYYSGGSGIILSRASLQLLGARVQGDVHHDLWATPEGGPEDKQTAITLRRLNITTTNSVDVDGKELFLPLGTGSEQMRRVRDEKLWFYKMCPNVSAGPGCCSARWVASHYHTPEDIYRMDDLQSAHCIDSYPSEWPHLQFGDYER